MDKVLLEIKEGYAIVTLNRPEAMNALSRELRADFVAVFERICADTAIRAVIITGSGKAFCAGFDLAELASSDVDASQEADNAVADAMASFKGPIIGAINGHAVTGGFEMALACDVLIASENARFADTHARVGILPGWGLSQKLPRMIGMSRAKEISLTGAPVFAEQAYAWGLVNHVVAADALISKAEEIASHMVQCVPQILLQYKAMIDEGFSKPFDDALAWETEKAIESAQQAMAAMIADRKDKVMDKGRREK